MSKCDTRDVDVVGRDNLSEDALVTTDLQRGAGSTRVVAGESWNLCRYAWMSKPASWRKSMREFSPEGLMVERTPRDVEESDRKGL